MNEENENTVDYEKLDETKELLLKVAEEGSYVKNPDIKVRTNLTFNLNYLI